VKDKITMRTVLDRFGALKDAAAAAVHPNAMRFRDLELHDTAMAYAAAVHKVSRKDRNR
jgi:hypothetical protein